MYFYFPFGDINRGSRIILYGGGGVGVCFEKQIRDNNYCRIVAVADKNPKKLDKEVWKDYCIITPDMLHDYEFDYIVVSVSGRNRQSALETVNDILGSNDSRIISLPYEFQHTWTPESLLIKRVFDDIGINNPSYWDIGACYPHRASNSSLFYVSGSRGLNVEANHSLKEFFDRYRPEDINIFAGVSDTNGEGAFMVCEKAELSTFNPDTAIFSGSHWNAEYTEKRTIKTYTLNRISEQYYNNTFPDFIDIDIEGLDERALRAVDFTYDSPKLIMVEGGPQVFNKILMSKECEGGGFQPYCRFEANTIYLRKDIYTRVLCV